MDSGHHDVSQALPTPQATHLEKTLPSSPKSDGEWFGTAGSKGSVFSRAVAFLLRTFKTPLAEAREIGLSDQICTTRVPVKIPLPNMWCAKAPTRSPQKPIYNAQMPWKVESDHELFRGVCNGQEVAIKRLRTPRDTSQKQMVEACRREAEIWASLSHPNILPLWELIETDGHFHQVTPFMHDQTLNEWTRGPSYKAPIGLRLLVGIASAIQYLHENDIVHGDIRDSNILVSSSADSMLCDFGLARREGTDAVIRARGSGSIRWSSPEVLNGEQRTFSSDVWAFGMLIYEILSRNPPYSECRSPGQIVAELVIHKRRPPRPPKTEDDQMLSGLWGIAETCWAENPEERASMRQAESRLEEFGTLPQRSGVKNWASKLVKHHS